MEKISPNELILLILKQILNTNNTKSSLSDHNFYILYLLNMHVIIVMTMFMEYRVTKNISPKLSINSESLRKS